MTRLTTKLLLLCLITLPAGCASSSGSGVVGNPPLVRVQVLAGQEQVTVAATAPPAMRSASEGAWRRVNFPSGGGVPITLSGGRWKVGNLEFPEGELFIQPQTTGSVSVNGSAYRGRYRFVPTAANRFDVVNDVDVEAYLMGVVSKEVLPDWHIEAFKAQAIAARTYALYEVRTSSNGRHFDVFDDVRSQVYGGIAGESLKSRQAVSETAGIVVAYGPRGNERIFKAYFSSCCGGVGQSAYDAFGDPHIPPLAAKGVGNQCSSSPRFNWTLEVSKTELAERIRAWAASRNRPHTGIAEITSVHVSKRNSFGRPVLFEIIDSRGGRYAIGSEDFRWACNQGAPGDRLVLSSYFEPVNQPSSIRFTNGHGYGHGVGLCQWCAQSQSLRGIRHEQIVREAYPGAVLRRAY